MRLKSIKLAGFKSFVDPTTVSFPSNLCAVVGPNGCGKSNIIDAVRWVMGESSAKNLRGEAMTDVIFNGSGERKPVGQASIELVFDNSEGKIVGEYAGYAEISVRRKVTRDSQNIYYLNGNKCRRRDITDIFLGTGLGPRSYAIIEQGMISRLIEAKPEELRVYIEEAAGISKYKERRRDTENRMRRTQENLERLTDIREELERQLLRLERQAQAALKYSEYKEQERLCKAQLQALSYQNIRHQDRQKQDAIKQLELKVEAANTDYVHYEAEIEKHRTLYTELGDTFNEVQGRYYSVGSDITRIEQSIQHTKERERQLRLDAEQTERDCRQAQEHLELDTTKAEGWRAELLEISPELELVSKAEEVSSSLLGKMEEDMQAWQQAWDLFNQRAAQPKQQAEVQQSRIQYLEQVQQRLLGRIEKFEAEKANFVVGDTESEIADLEKNLAELRLQAEKQKTTIERASGSLQTLKDRDRELVISLDEARSDLQRAKGRYASLDALQQSALGQGKGLVNDWLNERGFAEKPRLAETLVVEGGWETAVETVLGDFLQAVCVDGDCLDDMARDLSSIAGGQLVFMEPGQNQSTDAVIDNQWLLGKVKNAVTATTVSTLLKGIYVAESLADALARRTSLAEGESLITREGLWVGQNWLRVAKNTDAESGVIVRKQELEQLQVDIQGREQEIDSLAKELDTGRDSILKTELERDALRLEVEELGRQESELVAQVSARKIHIEQVLEGRERTIREIDEARMQLEEEAENLVEARALLAEAIASMETDTAEREKLLSRRDEIRSKLDNARQRARHDKDKSHELAMRHQAVNTQLASIQEGINRLQEQLQRMQERREALLDNLQDIAEPLLQNQQELEAALEKRVVVEEELSEARRKVEAAEAALREAEQARHRVEETLQSLRTELEKLRLEAQTLSVQAANLQQQLLADNFNIEILLENLDASLTEASLEEELARMANRISRLGAINLAAVEEYKLESSRKQYLDKQNDDLQEALETLSNAIKKIDRETRTRFKETFDQVNQGLQSLFPKVFGGGHAYLELTGEDLIDTGIAIMARPPGKKNSTIHLLSGGEKALTAIALVFSIFRLNPAPFCMLDEVDAPLDDANVGRYARLVEEMSDAVQFIYITHNKISMEIAHQLMGVTMHEPGVSRMVTVDVEEAAELAAV